ncbi:MAG TPA: YIP1 family protein [Candidatus Methanoperedenaceae archaeon]|nr:YIP1 family protein [Candidatus Methanoperedenaceae archaeon]
MDIQMLQNRVISLLKSPVAEMTKAKSEQISKMDTIKNYVAILALIPAIATFIGHAFIGISFGFFSYKYPIEYALVEAILIYVLQVASVFISGFVINALAPNFASKQNEDQAMKLAAFAATPGLIGGIFNIYFGLAIIGTLLALYGLYILYLGIPVLMETPKDKAITYLIVIIIVNIVIFVIIGAIVAAVMAALFLSSLTAGYGSYGYRYP